MKIHKGPITYLDIRHTERQTNKQRWKQYSRQKCRRKLIPDVDDTEILNNLNDGSFSRFCRAYEHDQQTDRQTDWLTDTHTQTDRPHYTGCDALRCGAGEI